jgi:mannosyltransferase
MWIDEVYTARDIDGSVTDVLPRLRAESSTPPLYSWLAWTWTRVAGDGDLALRSLSLLFGVAAIAVAFALGRSLSGRAAGLGAAALIAVNPFIVWYSQEARAYALFVLLGLLSLLALVHADRSGGRGATLAWGATCALALGTHHFAAVIVWPEAAWLLWRRRTRLTWLVVAVLGALQAALVALALEQSKNSEFIAEQAFGRRLANVPKQFALGQFANQLDSPLLVALAVVLVAATAAFVGLSQAGRRAAMPALALAGAIAALSVIPAAAGFDRLNGRNLILLLALALVAAGVALTTERRRSGFLLLGLLVALFAGVSAAVAVTPGLRRDDWKGVASELEALPRPLDVVVEPGAWTPALEHYLPRLQPLRAPNEPRLVAYLRVARPVRRLDARVPGLVERKRVLLPSAEIVVFDARRRVTPELLAEPVGGTFVASVGVVPR